jgi:hypothetical protein
LWLVGPEDSLAPPLTTQQPEKCRGLVEKQFLADYSAYVRVCLAVNRFLDRCRSGSCASAEALPERIDTDSLSRIMIILDALQYNILSLFAGA